ncbi:MAG: hypothetical protein P8R42_12730 [Candidatus Binatia bacterium]|nr:hypothetical protein [Candidatus Binatia bacterium]
MRETPMKMLIASAVVATLAIPALSGAIVLNGVSCEDFTITGTTTNGQLPSNGLNLEIHDCGPEGVSPFAGGNNSSCGNGAIDGVEQCDGAQLNGQSCQNRGFDGGTLRCNNVCSFDEGGCTSSPPPTGNGNCPDGYLTESVFTGQNTVGLKNVSIPPGTTKRYCLDVGEPLVGSSVDISRIIVSWGDATDYVCGAVEVKMSQLFGSYQSTKASTGTSGSVRFTSGRRCSGCVDRGVYQITIEGKKLYNPQDPNCKLFHITAGIS